MYFLSRISFSHLMYVCCSSYSLFNFHVFCFSKEDKKHFHCHFGLPLPPQVVVFAVGNWSGYQANTRIAIDVCLDESVPPQRVGFISKEQTSMCWDGYWEEPFILKSMELYEQVYAIIDSRLRARICSQGIQREDALLPGYPHVT